MAFLSSRLVYIAAYTVSNAFLMPYGKVPYWVL